MMIELVYKHTNIQSLKIYRLRIPLKTCCTFPNTCFDRFCSSSSEVLSVAAVNNLLHEALKTAATWSCTLPSCLLQGPHLTYAGLPLGNLLQALVTFWGHICAADNLNLQPNNRTYFGGLVCGRELFEILAS